MERDLLVPKLGLTMTEGTLVEWMVRPGEAFRADQSLFVIESEKAATEIPAEADGIFLGPTAEIGDILKVGDAVGRWKAMAGDASGDGRESPPGSEAVMKQAGAAEVDMPRKLSTPLARRMAKARGIPLDTLTGSGPRGRIRAADVPGEAIAPGLAAPEAREGDPSAAPASGAADLSPSAGTLRPPTASESTVARRLVAAKQEIPHFYLSAEAEVSSLLRLRADLNAAQSRRFTLNHFILAAVGRALEALPELNRVWTPEGILQLKDADVGMAVQTSRGLLVPVLRRVGIRSVSDIALDAAQAAERANQGRLGTADMAGGAITVSNAGMHDVTLMASIINPGQSMILGVGSVRGVFRPDEREEPVLRREIGLVLSADHRVLDGVSALRLLGQIREALHNPLRLLVAP